MALQWRYDSANKQWVLRLGNDYRILIKAFGPRFYWSLTTDDNESIAGGNAPTLQYARDNAKRALEELVPDWARYLE